MFPMVTPLMEVRQAKQHVLDVKDELTQQGIPFKENVKIGIMIETPTSAVISDLLAKEVCGKLAADPTLAKTFLDMEIDKFFRCAIPCPSHAQAYIQPVN